MSGLLRGDRQQPTCIHQIQVLLPQPTSLLLPKKTKSLVKLRQACIYGTCSGLYADV